MARNLLAQFTGPKVAAHMKRKSVRKEGKPSRVDVKLWTTAIENDVFGIDGDIERLVTLYQAQHGYTRDQANAALVRKLSAV